MVLLTVSQNLLAACMSGKAAEMHGAQSGRVEQYPKVYCMMSLAHICSCCVNIRHSYITLCIYALDGFAQTDQAAQ